jgi:hypothetical protein
MDRRSMKLETVVGRGWRLLTMMRTAQAPDPRSHIGAPNNWRDMGTCLPSMTSDHTTIIVSK